MQRRLLLGICIFGFLAGRLDAADHGDTPVLAMLGRSDAQITDSFAFLRGEISLEHSVFAPDFSWEPPPEGPTAGDYRGGAAAQRQADYFRDAFEDFSWEPSDVTLGPGTVLIDGEMSGRGSASGVEVGMTEHHVWTIRDGKALRLQMFTDRDEALAAAGISPAA